MPRAKGRVAKNPAANNASGERGRRDLKLHGLEELRASLRWCPKLGAAIYHLHLENGIIIMRFI